MNCNRCKENKEYGVSYLVGTHNNEIWVCKDCTHDVDVPLAKHCSNWGCNCSGWMEAVCK
jgi:hypothetical protein